MKLNFSKITCWHNSIKFVTKEYLQKTLQLHWRETTQITEIITLQGLQNEKLHYVNEECFITNWEIELGHIIFCYLI
jgi:hypothetical protein